ncbi:glycyl-tRNA synthetase subunit beta [Catenovulum agarivorans DS-2]|uniref:Glycyl-tRNA synthetase subunit beta n=1 Tax=Catenovulum agarivorans DS-2 TaxID=1328313 RepID=W7QY59_9ALTE|nr:DMT family transporter [Catenovulum agarivorans]EWH10240.1 glycyl-tRNA synthetase subunit beta [Catenovulum agarivorans DS-2]
MMIVLAILAGGIITLQASINSQFGTVLRSSMLATTFAFSVAALACAVAMLAISTDFLGKLNVKEIPFYYWFGGILSALGVGMYYFLIPRMGVGPMMSFALTGQLLVAVIFSHFGLFGFPEVPMSAQRAVGAGVMIVGLILLNR